SSTAVFRVFLNIDFSPRSGRTPDGGRTFPDPSQTWGDVPRSHSTRPSWEPTANGGKRALPARAHPNKDRPPAMTTSHVSLGPIERFLQYMWENNGSDLLLTAYNKPLVRIDGQLMPLEDEAPLDQDHVEHLVLSCLTEELKQELRTNKEVDFSFS